VPGDEFFERARVSPARSEEELLVGSVHQDLDRPELPRFSAATSEKPVKKLWKNL
jgi:hypothetical protein